MVCLKKVIMMPNADAHTHTERKAKAKACVCVCDVVCRGLMQIHLTRRRSSPHLTHTGTQTSK